MNRFFCLLALGAVATVTGCANYYAAPVVPPQGWAYARVNAPIDVDAHNTEVSMKMGKATSKSWLGIVAMGDCSAAEAAKAGGISTIQHLDYEFFNILGIYSTFTTVAYGE